MIFLTKMLKKNFHIILVYKIAVTIPYCIGGF